MSELETRLNDRISQMYGRDAYWNDPRLSIVGPDGLRFVTRANGADVLPTPTSPPPEFVVDPNTHARPETAPSSGVIFQGRDDASEPLILYGVTREPGEDFGDRVLEIALPGFEGNNRLTIRDVLRRVYGADTIETRRDFEDHLISELSDGNGNVFTVQISGPLGVTINKFLAICSSTGGTIAVESTDGNVTRNVLVPSVSKKDNDGTWSSQHYPWYECVDPLPQSVWEWVAGQYGVEVQPSAPEAASINRAPVELPNIDPSIYPLAGIAVLTLLVTKGRAFLTSLLKSGGKGKK